MNFVGLSSMRSHGPLTAVSFLIHSETQNESIFLTDEVFQPFWTHCIPFLCLFLITSTKAHVSCLKNV